MYGLIADVHAHNWNAFSSHTAEGLNNRLELILREVTRAGKAVLTAGGKTLIVAGDLFHVRGQLAPSVLNPTIDCFKALINQGLSIVIIPGNHDLEGKNSTRVSSAVTSLEGVGCLVPDSWFEIKGHADEGEDHHVIVVPWHDSVDALKATIETEIVPMHGGAVRASIDLIIHAPTNGVIQGIPDHGLDPAWLAGLGFKRVFSGHFHNYKSFEDGRVFSIGAIGHHSWSDVGSVAGFLLVDNAGVTQYESHMPKFVDVPAGESDLLKIGELVRGNYARAKITSSKAADVEGIKDLLKRCGALGSIVISVKDVQTERTGTIVSSVQSGASIEQSVSEYIKTTFGTNARVATIQIEALKVLAEAETA